MTDTTGRGSLQISRVSASAEVVRPYRRPHRSRIGPELGVIARESSGGLGSAAGSRGEVDSGEKKAQIDLSKMERRAERSGSVPQAVFGYPAPQKNGSVHADPRSSGKCWLSFRVHSLRYKVRSDRIFDESRGMSTKLD